MHYLAGETLECHFKDSSVVRRRRGSTRESALGFEPST